MSALAADRHPDAEADEPREIAQLARIRLSPAPYGDRRLARVHGIDDLASLARNRLPAGAWAYLEGGGEDERALRRNREAFDALELVPRVLRDVSNITNGVNLDIAGLFDRPPTWADLDWTRGLAGSGRAEGSPCRRRRPTCRRPRVDVVVSNHGGRQLDHVPAIDILIDELRTTMALVGAAQLADLTPSFVRGGYA